MHKGIEIGRFSNFQFPNENRQNNSLCYCAADDFMPPERNHGTVPALLDQGPSSGSAVSCDSVLD